MVHSIRYPADPRWDIEGNDLKALKQDPSGCGFKNSLQRAKGRSRGTSEEVSAITMDLELKWQCLAKSLQSVLSWEKY